MLYLCYLCRFKPLRDHLRGFLIAAWAGDKIAEFSFPEISFHFPLRPWFFFVSPAYAGKRRLAGLKCYHVRDHPRVCGEKGQKVLNQRYTTGSPPRMRGKEQRFSYTQLQARITPAYAGKSRIRRACTDRHRDHPRMCGEKTAKSRNRPSGIGSPPHVRGKVEGEVFAPWRLGITPACAGKRELRSASGSACRDHPRMCGEKLVK